MSTWGRAQDVVDNLTDVPDPQQLADDYHAGHAALQKLNPLRDPDAYDEAFAHMVDLLALCMLHPDLKWSMNTGRFMVTRHEDKEDRRGTRQEARTGT